VIFTSQRTEGDRGYEAMAEAMLERALKQPGCLGAESVRDAAGYIAFMASPSEHRHLAHVCAGPWGIRGPW
jgi:hypothetical protein